MMIPGSIGAEVIVRPKYEWELTFATRAYCDVCPTQLPPA